MASKTNVSDYRFSIFINNDQAKRSLIEMEKVMAGYEAELANWYGRKNRTPCSLGEIFYGDKVRFLP